MISTRIAFCTAFMACLRCLGSLFAPHRHTSNAFIIRNRCLCGMIYPERAHGPEKTDPPGGARAREELRPRSAKRARDAARIQPKRAGGRGGTGHAPVRPRPA